MTIPQVIAAIFLAIGALNTVLAAWKAETPGDRNAALASGVGCVVWGLLLWGGGVWS